MGPYPDDMNTVLAEVKKTGRYEYRHLGAMFVGALAAFVWRQHRARGWPHRRGGGALQLGGDRLKFMGVEMRELANAGTAAILSTIFSAPLFSLAALLFGYADDADGRRHGGGASAATVVSAPQVSKPVKTAVYLLSVAGALGAFMLPQRGGWWRFGAATLLRHGRGDIRARLGASCRHAWRLRRLALSWLRLGRGQAVCAARRSRRGEGGRCRRDTGSSWDLSPFTLFAGEAQTEMLAQQWTALGAGALLATGFQGAGQPGVPRLGWRGGHFFPLIFSGIAIGYAAAGLFGIDPVFALSVSTAALLGAAMRQPLMVALLLILCFPRKPLSSSLPLRAWAPPFRFREGVLSKTASLDAGDIAIR
ncbi:MAG: chloride channel protein [Adlercreutzia equolifaciens]